MQVKQAEYSSMLILNYEVQVWHVDCHPMWKEYEIYCNIVGAVAKWLRHQTAGTEVPGQVLSTAWDSWVDLPLTTASPHPGVMGSWHLGNHSNGAGMSS